VIPYFAGPWLAAVMIGLGPVMAAIAAIVAGTAVLQANRDVGKAGIWFATMNPSSEG